MNEFSEEQLISFLKFTWGRTRLPSTASEFTQSNLFTIAKLTVNNPDSHFPLAHTCYFTLDLPNYSSKEILYQRLVYSITECSTIDADYEVDIFGD